MTPKGLLKLALALLLLSGFGFIAVIFFQFAHFAHQGNSLDWTYDLGGLFVMVGICSLIFLIITIVLTAKERREKVESSDFRLTGRN